MPGGAFETVGAQPRNPSKGKAIMPAIRFETGLATNRSALIDPSPYVYAKFYGGYPDVLLSGSNMEVSNKRSLIRRPGNPQWSSVTVPNPPNWFYDWRTLDKGINVIVDTSVGTYIQTASSQTQIFTKSAGAGQGYYQGVADTLYYGDGVDLQKYTPGNPNGTTWNWGIAAPTVAPVVAIIPSSA